MIDEMEGQMKRMHEQMKGMQGMEPMRHKHCPGRMP